MKEQTGINVIIYCRVSTDEQRKGTSVDVQEERLKAYCIYKGYNIINTPEFNDCKEDESAKTFERRPVMQAIMKYIRKHRGQVQKLLFLRWNRFSRDLFTATDVVRELLDLGVEPNAIEEELNFDSTSWPVLLGAYIGIAQSDNIARAKSVKDGIRGTMKKGRCAYRAPRGYKNVRESKHNCYVIVIEDTATPIRNAFIELSKGVFSVRYIHRKYCPNIPESTFFNMMRNPFYMGKIRIPAYKDEPEEMVQGVHEALVSEDVFFRVQTILDRRRTTTPKLEKRINPDLFLRKFLICPICGYGLTGATSRGNGGHYTYYYCSEDSKHLCIRADVANEMFARFVSTLKPNPTVLKLYESVLLGFNQEQKRKMKTEIESIKTRIAEKNKQIEEVEDMMVSDRTNSDRYSKIIARYEKEIKELEFSAEMMRIANGAHIKPKLQYAISLINNVVMYIRDAPFEVKIKLIGSMFPEKIEFDGKQHRTKNMNKVLDLIYQQTNELRGNKKQNKANFFKSALSGEPDRALLEPILLDLEKLWELRFWIPNPGEPISPQSFYSTDQ